MGLPDIRPTTTSSAPVTLVVPSNAAYVRLVRLVVSSLAADLDYDVEEVEDLRIVADELVSAVIASAVPNCPIRIEITATEVVTMHVSSDALLDQARLDPLAAQIVAALTETFSVGVEEGRVSAGFHARRPNSDSRVD